VEERVKKVRVRLYDKKGTPTSDRLVTQLIEFNTGPKDTIEDGGSVSIEAYLQNQDDIEKFIDYLKKLSGQLPVRVVGQRGRPAGTKIEFNVAERGDLVNEILTEAKKKDWDQDKLINTLREKHQFRFISEDFAESMGHKYGDGRDNPLGVISSHYNKYEWMCRTVRLAADPKNDKYDPLLAFGVRFRGGRSARIVIYLEGKYHDRVKIPVPEKPKVTEKNISSVRYPAFMTYDERAKFRNELRKAKRGKEPSPFLLKWMPHMDEVNPSCEELSYPNK